MKMKTLDKAKEASYLVAQRMAESSIKESCCAIAQTMFRREFEIIVKQQRHNWNCTKYNSYHTLRFLL
ncbi:Hypothetical predicted protein [Octopus vulgaris]|uniref:Uncharacterized protein n=1 Tax=Octopus vulgaris TaxID=6645 RepID=A0AA36AQS8_OCTVU|nr:Hypothetical predicted protein [Octopus vulgaris]